MTPVPEKSSQNRLGLARATVITSLRVVVTAAVILLALTPVPRPPDGSIQTTLTIIALLLIWSLIFAIVFRWQIRRIHAADDPQTRMIEALAVIFVLFLAVFAKAYHLLSVAYPASFTERMDFFAALYFALTVLSTVGFGDITPVGTVARGLTMVQMTLDLVLLGVAVRVITGAAQRARDRKQRATAPISDKQDPQEPSSS